MYIKYDLLSVIPFIYWSLIVKSQQKRIELVTRLGMYAAEEERIKYIATMDKKAMKQATDSIVTVRCITSQKMWLGNIDLKHLKNWSCLNQSGVFLGILNFEEVKLLIQIKGTISSYHRYCIRTEFDMAQCRVGLSLSHRQVKFC